MEEVRFALEPGGRYGDVTKDRDVTVDLWCAEINDILVLTGQDRRQAIEDLSDTVGVYDHVRVGPRTILVTDTCLKGNQRTVEPFVQDHGCVLVPPIHYAGGAKECQVWSRVEGDLTALYEDLRSSWDVHIETKRSIEKIDPPDSSVAAQRPNLSSRQSEALRTAIDEGYYAIPRGTTTEDIAGKMGITRRTAENHLRRAEQKVIEAYQ